MADNTTINAGSGGDVVRDKDRSGVKTQIVGLDVGIGGTEQLMTAAAAADATANPTLPAWLTHGLVFNGTTWDRPRTIDALKTAGASDVAGIPVYAPAERRFTSVSLATAANSVQSWDTEGAAQAVIYMGTSTTGTVTFEVSADGTNWYAAEVVEVTTDRIYTGINITPTANLVFRVYTAGTRNVRARTVTTLGATVAFTTTLSSIPGRYVTLDTGQGRSLLFASISAASSGNNTLVAAAAAGLKIKVVSYVIVADGAVTATFQSGAGGTALSGAMSLAANGGVSAVGQVSSHLMETAAATLLNLSLGSAVGVRGHLSYFLEP